MSENKENLEKVVVEKIIKGEVNMKPKFLFIATYSLLVIGIIGLFLTSAWLINVFIYKLRSQQLWEYMSYGEPGMQVFMHNIPFGAIVLSTLSFLLGLLLLKKFDICYKKSFKLIVIIFLLGITVTAIFLDTRGLNTTLEQKKYLGAIYHNQMLNPDWLIGTVIYRDPKGYYMRNVDGRFFRAIPVKAGENYQIFNRSDCVKIRGVITDDYTIYSHALYKCPFKMNK